MLINDILDISKIESGKLTLSENRTQFRDALYETVSMVISKAVEKRLKLSIYIDPDLPTELMLDEHRLRQIVMNLLSNALKFTAQGYVELIVSGKLQDQRCILTIEVKDSGIGIAKESQEAIFKPFVQEDGSITREFGGTGLGLAISSQLVQLMGGEIKCFSEKGEGSCFCFDVSLALVDDSEVLEAPSVGEQKQVIIIDENGHKTEILERELAYLGVEIVGKVATITEIPNDLSTRIALLYCQADLPKARRDIQTLVANYAAYPLIVVQETDDESFDFRDQIGGQMMLPLLGKRCLEIITSTIDNRAIDKEKVDEVIVEPESDKRLILVVEDNLVNQKVATFFLKSFGYDFEIAENGLEAVNRIKEGAIFNAILMDCMMPIMDGFTATEEIRCFEKQNELKKTPVIALTASIFDEDIEHCYAVGMDDYLAKPIDKVAFEEKLKKYVTPH